MRHCEHEIFGVEYRDGDAFLEGLRLSDLATAYETPLYVFSEARLWRNVKDVTAAYRSFHDKTEIFYASKACSNLAVLDVVRRAGASIEVNSSGELWKALQAKFRPDQIVLNGVAKSVAELRFAVERGVRCVNADSEFELRRIAKIAQELDREVPVAIRVEPGIQPPTHPGLDTAYQSKFGIEPTRLIPACEFVKKIKGFRLVGLHIHVGSQVPSSAPFAEAAELLVSLAKKAEKRLGLRLEHLNLGGGLPVAYKVPRGRKDYFAPWEAEEKIVKATASKVHKWREDVELFVEPGRRIVGNAALLLTRIENWKEKRIKGKLVRWLLLDAGFNTLPEARLYDWYFPIIPVRLKGRPRLVGYRLGGPLCDGGDIFHALSLPEFRQLPAEMKPGDLLAFLGVGAYTLEQMTQYNGRGRAAAVMIRMSGAASLVRERDSLEDLTVKDVLSVPEAA